MATPDHLGNALRYKDGEGTNDNDVAIQTGDVSAYNEFTLQSATGAVDVFVSLDGVEYSTAPLSLIDLGATTSDPVIVTSADRTFAFFGTYALIRVLQNGASAVTGATLMCKKS